MEDQTDQAALDAMVERTYARIKQIAARMSGVKAGTSVSPTVVANETHLKFLRSRNSHELAHREVIGLFKEGKYRAAENTVRSTVKVMAASPLAGKDQAGIVSLMLGEAILKQGRYREAEPLLVEAYDILRKTTRKSYAPHIPRGRADVAELYQALHEPDKIPANVKQF